MSTTAISSQRSTSQPILKWAGGKRQLLSQLLPEVPEQFGKYIEPFFGGGALFFALQPQQAVIADANDELVRLYEVLRDDVESLIVALGDFKTDEDSFYAVRAMDESRLSKVDAAARTIYLNRTCFNGLYRVNRQGQFNVPYGRYRRPRICAEENLRAASAALATTTIVGGDYLEVLKTYAAAGDFVFLDPPYLPISQYSDFKRYTAQQFREEDHVELAAEVQRLTDLGCHVVLTNSNHEKIRELYRQFDLRVVASRRNINKNGNGRRGEDLIVTATAKPAMRCPPATTKMTTRNARSRQTQLPESPSKVAEADKQIALYPSTRFMGSKSALLQHIWSVASAFKFETVCDLFCGSGIVSYLFKAHGKQVLANDQMAMCATNAAAVIANNSIRLSGDDVEMLLEPASDDDRFVAENFDGLYFTRAENQLIDSIRANLKRFTSPTKRAIARAALIRACVKKRPRGIFTYTGNRYDDGRRDLKISLATQFREAVEAINGAVFSNGKKCQSRRGDALKVPAAADLVYLDPPYFSPHSDNEYVRRYHFVEGIACDWQGVEMQWETKTRKFRNYPTPFRQRDTADTAFDTLLARHANSIQIVSYSSNSLPTRARMVELMSRYKRKVEVIAVDHRYSFGTQRHKVDDNNNQVKEYLFVGSD